MDRQTVLVLGASGMVGSKFVETYGKDFEILIPDEHEVDLTDGESVKKFFELHPGINAVVNFAAYTNVSEAEKMKGDKESLCWKINVNGAENLAAAVKGRGVYVIQISTDMVFAGDEKDKGPYAEGHQLEPDAERLTWYGYTKAMAEKILTEKLSELAILRIIYPVTKQYALKPDYLRGPLKYYGEKGELYPVFEDQQMNISDIDEINEAIKKLLNIRLTGVFHGGASDVSTPYELISRLFGLVYGTSEMVKRGKLIEGVRYPKYGGLINKQTQEKLGMKFSSCEEIVEKVAPR